MFTLILNICPQLSITATLDLRRFPAHVGPMWQKQKDILYHTTVWYIRNCVQLTNDIYFTLCPFHPRQSEPRVVESTPPDFCSRCLCWFNKHVDNVTAMSSLCTQIRASTFPERCSPELQRHNCVNWAGGWMRKEVRYMCLLSGKSRERGKETLFSPLYHYLSPGSGPAREAAVSMASHYRLP